MRRLLAPIAAAAIAAGCGPGPTEEEQALDSRGEHPTAVAHPPEGNPDLREGPVTPGERGSIYNAADNQNALSPGNEAAAPDAATAQPEAEAAAAVVERFGALLEQRQFDEARQLYADGGAASGLTDEQFAAKFEEFETIDAAVAYPARVEGAAGSLYAEVQLTLSGELAGGEPYSRTGTVTLRRANNVPGATEEQLQWRIVKVRLGTPAAG